MTLWTPGGEKQVKSETTEQPGMTGPDGQELTEEQKVQAEQMAKQLTEARSQILEAKAADVLANHAMGIYELAAIHLTAEEPKFEEAKLAIDGLAALVDGLEGKLGEAEVTLKEALQQLQLGYVQRTQAAQESTETKTPEESVDSK